MSKLDPAVIRKDFPIFSKPIGGKRLVYLDSAATSQKPKQVVEAIQRYYYEFNANIHRGIYKISERATEAYEGSKKKVCKLINSSSVKEIIYVRNTTEALNTIALTYGEQNVSKGDHILISDMEHHSNIVPWQLLSKRKGAHLDFAPLRDDAFIDLDKYEKLLQNNPRIVSITHVSNVLGTINEVKKLTSMAKKAGATVIIDGAQSVPHMPVDISDIGCDFFAFSSHKMLGPSGIGVLYGKEELLEQTEPLFGGGDMISSVRRSGSEWNELPWKFEAGTPNIEGAIGLSAAIDYLNAIGMQNIREHEEKITRYAMESLTNLGGVEVYGPKLGEESKRGGVVSFGINGVHPHDVSQVLDDEGVAIRAGHHCAMPLVTEVLRKGSVSRMSFYIYNDEADVDVAISGIKKVKDIFHIR
ncbi:MAG: cysteine desulfurase [Candidatus Micrarchaeaceae archaeon]